MKIHFDEKTVEVEAGSITLHFNVVEDESAPVEEAPTPEVAEVTAPVEEAPAESETVAPEVVEETPVAA